MAMNYRWQYTKTQRDIKIWFDAVELDRRIRFGDKGRTEDRQPFVDYGDNFLENSPVTKKI